MKPVKSAGHYFNRFKEGHYFNPLKEENGNLESALTLIPLMILFLTVLQLGIGVYSRDSIGESTQGSVAYAAMGQVNPLGEDSNFSWSNPPIALPLPGGGSLLVGERTTKNSAITPLLPGGDSFTSTGIAVQE